MYFVGEKQQIVVSSLNLNLPIQLQNARMLDWLKFVGSMGRNPCGLGFLTY